jgi:hypothetical protein
MQVVSFAVSFAVISLLFAMMFKWMRRRICQTCALRRSLN